jgi:hypothetical protein
VHPYDEMHFLPDSDKITPQTAGFMKMRLNMKSEEKKKTRF